MLFAAVVLKFVPVSTTLVPATPEAGVKEVIVGTWLKSVPVKNKKNNTEKSLLRCFIVFI
jgi:hypothetical protein